MCSENWTFDWQAIDGDTVDTDNADFRSVGIFP